MAIYTDAPFASTKGDAYPKVALSSAVAELAKHWKCAPVDAQKTLSVNLRTMVGLKNTARALQLTQSA